MRHVHIFKKVGMFVCCCGGGSIVQDATIPRPQLDPTPLFSIPTCRESLRCRPTTHCPRYCSSAACKRGKPKSFDSSRRLGSSPRSIEATFSSPCFDFFSDRNEVRERVCSIALSSVAIWPDVHVSQPCEQILSPSNCFHLPFISTSQRQFNTRQNGYRQ